MTAAITGTCLVLLVGFLFTRYGNEHMDYMTYAEVNGIRYLYSIAKPDSLFISGWNDTPWQYQDYEKYTCYSMADVLPEAVITGDANAVIRFIKGQKRPYTYLLFTRGEKAQAYSLSGVPVGALDRLEAALLKSGKFKLIYKNPDVQVLIYQGGTS